MPEEKPEKSERLTLKGLLTRIEALEDQVEALKAKTALPEPPGLPGPPALQVLDVNMVPTAEEVEGARTLLEPGGPAQTVQTQPAAPHMPPMPAAPPVLVDTPPPAEGEDGGTTDQQAGAVVRRMLRAASIPFTQVRVRWEMNERRAAIYLDRDAVMDMLTDPEDVGGRYMEIVEWGEAICHTLAAGPAGERQETMKWFPYSRDDDAWWGAKVLIPHLGV